MACRRGRSTRSADSHPAQPYGGELLLRLYLFSLPFAACLAVLPLVSDRPTGLDLRRALSLLLMGSVLATATIVSRYGNDGMESFNADELEVVNELYATAPHGVDSHRGGPQYAVEVPELCGLRLPVPHDVGSRHCGLFSHVWCGQSNRRKARRLLIITESQLQAADLRGTFPVADLQRFMAECGSSPGWTKTYENAGGVIFKIEGAGNGK